MGVDEWISCRFITYPAQAPVFTDTHLGGSLVGSAPIVTGDITCPFLFFLAAHLFAVTKAGNNRRSEFICDVNVNGSRIFLDE